MVVVGGGFGGVNATRALARADVDVDVTVDRTNHHLFQPLLHQVATHRHAHARASVGHLGYSVLPTVLARLGRMYTAALTGQSIDHQP